MWVHFRFLDIWIAPTATKIAASKYQNIHHSGDNIPSAICMLFFPLLLDGLSNLKSYKHLFNLSLIRLN